MRRQPASLHNAALRSRRKLKQVDQEADPDFYAMAQSSPLPPNCPTNKTSKSGRVSKSSKSTTHRSPSNSKTKRRGKSGGSNGCGSSTSQQGQVQSKKRRSSSTDESEPECEPCEYELAREERIKRNKEKLATLGLDGPYKELYGKEQRKKKGSPKKTSAKNAVRSSPRGKSGTLPSERARAAGITPVNYRNIKMTKKDQDIAQAVLRIAEDEQYKQKIRLIVKVLVSQETLETLANYHALYNTSGTRHMYIVHNDVFKCLEGQDDNAQIDELLKRDEFIPGLHYFIDEEGGPHSFDLYLEHIGYTF